MLLNLSMISEYSKWYLDIFFYLFIITLFISIYVIKAYHAKIKIKNSEYILALQQYAARIDNIRKDHSDKSEKIRLEMLRREEDRTRQWIESEKETLHVLSGVSNLLDLSEKINRVESDKILGLLVEIAKKVEQITE